MKTLISILTTAVFLISCSKTNVPDQVVSVEFTEIAQDFLAGDGAEGIQKQNIVINNESVWDDLKSKMNAVNNETDLFNETEIDFSNFYVIAAFEEVKNSGEFQLSIIEVLKSSKNIFVKTKTESTSGQSSIQIITQPYHIIKLPKSDLPIIFE